MRVLIPLSVVCCLGLVSCSGTQTLISARETDPAAVSPAADDLARNLESQLEAAIATGGSDETLPANTWSDPSGGRRALLQRPGAPFPPVRFLVLSDTHHLSSDLWEPGNALSHWLATNDGKVLVRSDALLQAIEATVRRENRRAPLDFVAITGDLTTNGAAVSHRELAAAAERIAAIGVPVYVIPGNHDVLNPWAARLAGGRPERVASVSPEEFATIYDGVGYGAAVSRAPDDLSYRVDVGDRLSLLMLDSAQWSRNEELGYPRTPGAIGIRQREWLGRQLGEIREAGRAPLVFMHHNLLAHGRARGYATLQYVVDEAPRLARMLWDGGAPIVFTGHIHARNATGLRGQAGEWIYDLAASATSLYPHEYRLVTIDDRQRLRLEPRLLGGFPEDENGRSAVGAARADGASAGRASGVASDSAADTDARFREWSLATYLSDVSTTFSPNLRQELLASSSADRIGRILCAGAGASRGSAALSRRDPGEEGDCDGESRLELMTLYLGVWSALHRSGTDSVGVPAALTANSTVLRDGEELWRTVAPERFESLLDSWSADPPPTDGSITIDLRTGRWRAGHRDRTATRRGTGAPSAAEPPPVP